jgi:YceI-like domain
MCSCHGSSNSRPLLPKETGDSDTPDHGIKPGNGGVRVTGSLTVRGRTRPVSFDAKVSSADGELWLDGEVQFNRRTWASTPSSPARRPARSASASPCSSAPEQSAVTGPSWTHGAKHDSSTSLTRARTPRYVSALCALARAPAAGWLWRAGTRAERLTWASTLGTHALLPRLPAHDPVVRLDVAARAQRRLERRGDLGVAARGRRPAPPRHPAETALG